MDDDSIKPIGRADGGGTIDSREGKVVERAWNATVEREHVRCHGSRCLTWPLGERAWCFQSLALLVLVTFLGMSIAEAALY